jgi:hypothetical protein
MHNSEKMLSFTVYIFQKLFKVPLCIPYTLSPFFLAFVGPKKTWKFFGKKVEYFWGNSNLPSVMENFCIRKKTKTNGGFLFCFLTQNLVNFLSHILARCIFFCLKTCPLILFFLSVSHGGFTALLFFSKFS